MSETARIFADPTLTASFFVTGGGWISDTRSGEAGLLAVDAANLGFAWDAAGKAYRIDSREFGSGLLLRRSDYYAHPFAYRSMFSAALAPGAGLRYFSLSVLETQRSDDPYNHVTVFDPAWEVERDDKTKRTGWAWAGAAQATPANAVKGTGVVRYRGDLAATMVGNFGDQLVGTAEIDVDFATRTLTGSLEVYLQCFMGCSYPPVRLPLTGGAFDTASGTVEARIESLTLGTLAGRFAGPAGEEMLLRTEFGYRDPERQSATQAAGILILRRI